MKIKVHHLNNSKSQRILWALEELGLDYEIEFYTRQPSFAAPDEIKNIHPLGKAPVVEIDDFVMAESGAVVQYLIERFGNGQFMPNRESSSYAKYIELMHYPEGSLSPPLLDQLFIRMLPIEDETFKAFTKQRVMQHLGYVDGLLEGQEYLIDNEFSGADLQLTFNLLGMNARGGLSHFNNLEAFVVRMKARDAYKRSIEKGGELDMGFKKQDAFRVVTQSVLLFEKIQWFQSSEIAIHSVPKMASSLVSMRQNELMSTPPIRISNPAASLVESVANANHQIYSRARKARDARFDGLFFVGVKTTGIYCRPICPAPAALEKNVEYFASALGAAQAGLRPCLRCRPDSSPGSNAWQGTETTLRRAIDLINQGELSDSSLPALAVRLGVSDRYLRKLFSAHLGVAPKQYALYQQCLFAKKLLQETRLPVADIAYAAGFNSVRRFNSSIKAQLSLTPTQLRRHTIAKSSDIVLQLSYRPPYDTRALFDFLGRRCIEGLETFDGQIYSRTIVYGRNDTVAKGHFSISASADKPIFDVYIHINRLELLYPIVVHLRALFDLDAPIADIADHLYTVFGGHIKFSPGLRVPGIWGLFEAGVRAVLGQQVTVTAAKNLVTKLVHHLGEKTNAEHAGLDYYFPTETAVLESDLSFLSMPQSRKDTLQRLAQHFLVSAEPSHLDDWLEIKGIGPWTVNYVKLRALKDPDVWLAGDAGIKNALKKVPLDGSSDELKTPSIGETLQSENLKPWRSYATLQLWNQL